MTTRVTYTTISGNPPYAVPFPFLSRSHVYFMLAGAALDAADVEWVTESTVRPSTEPEAGLEFRVWRSTQTTPLVQYQNAAMLTREELETDSLQALYRVEEMVDAFDDISIDPQEIIDLLLLNQEFNTLLQSLITNTFYESNTILQLGVIGYNIPILSAAGATVAVDRTHRSGIVLCTSAAPVTVTFPVWADDEAVDLGTGDFISFKQATVGGQVTLTPPSGSTFAIPVGFLAKTRGENSIITATCELGEGNTWTLSGDLAVDSTASSRNPVAALASVGGILTIDCAVAEFITVDLAENIDEIAFIGAPGVGYAQRIRVRFKQHASAAKTVAWPASFKWAGGTPGTVSATLSSYNELEVTTYDQGTRWEASLKAALA